MPFVLNINAYNTIALAFDAIPEDECSLDLSGNHLGERSELELAEIFRRIPARIISLDLSWNELGDAAATILVANVKPNLKTLDLSGNNIGDNGAVALASSVNFTSMTISENEIGPVGGAAFAANNHLKILDMNHNALRQRGAIPFRDNKSLTYLDISYNSLGGDNSDDEAGDEDAIAMSANTTLKSLFIHGSGVTKVGATALASSKLTLLGINKNNIGDEGFQAYTARSTLKSLMVEDNNIGMPSAEAFQANTSSIIALQANDNPMGAPGVAIITGALERNLAELKNLISVYVFSSLLAPSRRPESLAIIFHHISSFLISEKDVFTITASAEKRYASIEPEQNDEESSSPRL